MVSDKMQTPAGLPVKGFVVNASTWNNFMGLFMAYFILAPWLTVPTSGHLLHTDPLLYVLLS